MKILVRQYDYETPTCSYVWKEVRKENPFSGLNYNTTDGNYYNIGSILQVDHDFRKSGKYVMCGNCGKVIKRSEADKHYEDIERRANCLNCDWLKLRPVDGTTKYKMTPDGKVVTRELAEPYCSKGYHYSSYNHIPIAEVDRVSICKWYKCRRTAVKEFTPDIFVAFQNPFKTLLTEKAVIDGGWKFDCVNDRSCVTYKNSDGKVHAVFDQNGIIDHFYLSKRNEIFYFRYSDTHDEFLDVRGVFRWAYISDSRIARYKKQIRKLYGK